MAYGFAHRCHCCGALVHAPVWDVAQPGNGKSIGVCMRCGPHCSLKADGTLYVPPDCPSPPHPKLRVLHPADPDDAAPSA